MTSSERQSGSKGLPMAKQHVRPDDIRDLFSRAMSDMYRAEVPQYQTLLELVADVNAETLRHNARLRAELERTGEIERLAVERHGAIRLGTAEELFNIRRVFATMGMQPVGYYDLSAAGLPVHSTAFRPVTEEGLRHNPFRIFTSLLRLELIDDLELRDQAAEILAARRVFTPRTLELVDLSQTEGGLTRVQAEEFVREALETFRWHKNATVDLATYQKLHKANRLIADIISFNGPHINHLTPRTLDIDAVQSTMPRRGIAPKAVIEGPPRRNCPILLRQTSFKALEEQILFRKGAGEMAPGTHAARFGEIEQRGVALTSKGRDLYDTLLAAARRDVRIEGADRNSFTYESRLSERFRSFPDDWDELRRSGLAFFRYSATAAGVASKPLTLLPITAEELIARGFLRFDPIVYEDFLPASAAGIFQSNLGNDEKKLYDIQSSQEQFEAALGIAVRNELELYAQAERVSLEVALTQLGPPYDGVV